MTPTIAEKKKYTYEDYLKTPDDKRYELLEGELHMTPSPVIEHQRISGKLDFELRKFIADNDLGEVFYAPCDVHFDDENVVQPDIMFISKNRLGIIGEKNIQGAPDLTIEIISENSADRDMIQKKRLYAKFGVKEYWIVIPEEKSVDIYVLKNNILQLYSTYNKDDIIESPYLKDLKISLKKVFNAGCSPKLLKNLLCINYK